MARRWAAYARLGAVTQAIFAGLIGVPSLLHAEPGFAGRGVVLMILYALPAGVALFGISGRRPALIAAGAAASAVGAVLSLSGFFVIFLIPGVLLGAGALGLARTGTTIRSGRMIAFLVQAALALVLVGLMIGAGAAALFDTDAGCWIEYRTPTGTRIEPLPYSTDGMELSGDAISGGCTTGLISTRGAGIGALLGTSALALSGVAARRRERAPEA